MIDSTKIGAYRPKCKSDGSFEEKQCHASSGHCWCVESVYGNEILGTRRRPGQKAISCGMLTSSVKKYPFIYQNSLNPKDTGIF